MRRVGGRWWVQGVGYAYRRWWILRLVRRCMVICAPSAPGCGTGLLAATADTPLFSFSKSRLRSVALTLLGQSQLAVYSSYYYLYYGKTRENLRTKKDSSLRAPPSDS